MKPTIFSVATDYADAVEFKRIVTAQLGQKCPDFDPDCMTCQAHKIADLLLETTSDELRRLSK